MSLNDVFDELDKEDKPTLEKAAKTSQEPDSDASPIPEEGDKTDDKAVEEVPSPKAEGVDDLFAPAVDEPVGEESVNDKPADDQSVKKEVVSETPAEKTPATDAPSVVDDDWFEPAKEEPTSDESAEDQPIEEPAKEKVDEASPGEETTEGEALAEVDDDWFTPAVPEEHVYAKIPTEMRVDKGTLIAIEASPIVSPAISPEAMREQMKTFQSLKASLLDKSTDIAQIQGKPFVKRSGWRKFALVFNITDDIIKAEKEDIGDDFEWRFWVKATAPNGRSVIGIGSCCSDEREFTHRRHDVLAVAHTRAKNRALSDLIGSGEVSWEELRGMG